MEWIARYMGLSFLVFGTWFRVETIPIMAAHIWCLSPEVRLGGVVESGSEKGLHGMFGSTLLRGK